MKTLDPVDDLGFLGVRQVLMGFGEKRLFIGRDSQKIFQLSTQVEDVVDSRRRKTKKNANRLWWTHRPLSGDLTNLFISLQKLAELNRN
jgi:hypothetical protein